MELPWEALRLLFLASLPQAWAYFVFGFAFISPQPAKLYRKLFWLFLIHSIYTEALMPYISLALHMLNSQLAVLALLYLFFRDVRVKKLFVVFMISTFTLVLGDIILVTMADEVFGVASRDSLLGDHFPLALALVYALMIPVLIASRFISRRQFPALKRLTEAFQGVGRNPLMTVVVLILVQFVLLAALRFTQHTDDRDNHLLNSAIVYLIVFVSLLILAAAGRLILRARESAVRMAQEAYVEDINGMFASIRGQRHEFINHLQVVHGMAQMNRPEQLKSYLAELVQESRALSDIVRHSSPALAAFVQAKLTIAEGAGIAFEYALPEQWDASRSSIKTIDLIKIWGNLVDNAFDETLLQPPGGRYVRASIVQSDGTVVLAVSNTGRVLDKTQREAMFRPGFSTKGEGHSGLGLAIIAERVQHYNGRIEVAPFENRGLSIRVTLPDFGDRG